MVIACESSIAKSRAETSVMEGVSCSPSVLSGGGGRWTTGAGLIASVVAVIVGGGVSFAGCACHRDLCRRVPERCWSERDGCWSERDRCWSERERCWSDRERCWSDRDGCWSDRDACWSDHHRCPSHGRRTAPPRRGPRSATRGRLATPKLLRGISRQSHAESACFIRTKRSGPAIARASIGHAGVRKHQHALRSDTGSGRRSRLGARHLRPAARRGAEGRELAGRVEREP